MNAVQVCPVFRTACRLCFARGYGIIGAITQDKKGDEPCSPSGSAGRGPASRGDRPGWTTPARWTTCAGRQGVCLEPKAGDIGEHGADSFPRIIGLHACAEGFFRFAAFTPCQKGQERHNQKRQNQQDNQRDTQDIPYVRRGNLLFKLSLKPIGMIFLRLSAAFG